MEVLGCEIQDQNVKNTTMLTLSKHNAQVIKIRIVQKYIFINLFIKLVKSWMMITHVYQFV